MAWKWILSFVKMIYKSFTLRLHFLWRSIKVHRLIWDFFTFWSFEWDHVLWSKLQIHFGIWKVYVYSKRPFFWHNYRIINWFLWGNRLPTKIFFMEGRGCPFRLIFGYSFFWFLDFNFFGFSSFNSIDGFYIFKNVEAFAGCE